MKADKRNNLGDDQFAIPSKRKYPIDTKGRARAALSRAADPNNEGAESTVRSKVLQKYPSLRKDGSERGGPSARGQAMRKRGRGKKKGHAKQQLRRWGS